MTSLKYTIKEHLATLSTHSDGNKEFNIISWNDGIDKYDLRKWQSNGNPGKGLTMDDTELTILFDAICSKINKNPLNADGLHEKECSKEYIEECLEKVSWLEADKENYRIIPEEVGIHTDFDSVVKIIKDKKVFISF